MKPCRLDHLVVVAPRLDVGANLIRRALGVELQMGGCHPRMGTHNLLLKLGETSYLEVIAPDPEATPPDHPRWFGMDELGAEDPARLVTWVARTESIEQTRAACTEPLGDVETMSRGALTWHITIPSDGRLALGGALPSLIQWQKPPHPASTLRDIGCSLDRLEIHTPDVGRVQTALESLKFEGNLTLHETSTSTPVGLIAHIHTSAGMRVLGKDDDRS